MDANPIVAVLIVIFLLILFTFVIVMDVAKKFTSTVNYIHEMQK